MTVAVLLALAALVLILALGANSTDTSVSDVHCYLLESTTACPTPMGILR